MSAKKNDDAPTAADLGLEPQTPEPVVEPQAENEQETAVPPKARRGRPPGGGTKSTADKPKKSASKKAEDLEGFAKQLQGIHVMIAMMTGISEAALSDTESKMLASSLNAVSEEYGLALDGKTGAAIQLFGTAAIIYAPRALAFNVRMKKEKMQRDAKDEERTVDATAVMYPAHASANH